MIVTCTVRSNCREFWFCKVFIGAKRCTFVLMVLPMCLWCYSMVLPMYDHWQRSQLYSYITQDSINPSVSVKSFLKIRPNLLLFLLWNIELNWGKNFSANCLTSRIISLDWLMTYIRQFQVNIYLWNIVLCDIGFGDKQLQRTKISN